MEHEAYLKLSDLFEYWSTIVRHFGWRVKITYCWSAKDLPRGVEAEAAATTFSDRDRLWAEIIIYLPEASKDMERLEELVVHELAHILLNAGTPEAQTTRVTMVLMGLAQERNEEE